MSRFLRPSLGIITLAVYKDKNTYVPSKDMQSIANVIFDRSPRDEEPDRTTSREGIRLDLFRTLLDPSPLASTQSAQSPEPKYPSLFPESKTKPETKPTPVGQQPRTNRHKGIRMLNGRVYADRKKNPNPYASIKEDPGFVEWGYGGMGSVEGAKSAGISSNWERMYGELATGGGDKTRMDVGVDGVGIGIDAGDADSDDGSGLAWVKRRKMERERKAREQKEKEEKEAEKKKEESQTNTHENKRVFQASVRAHHHRPHRQLSTEGFATLPQNQVVVSPILVSPGTGGSTDTLDASTGPLHTSTTAFTEIDKHTLPSSFSFSSELGSESEVDDGEFDANDDDDDEYEVEDTRRTAIAAGVEKISRHRE